MLTPQNNEERVFVLFIFAVASIIEGVATDLMDALYI